MDEDGLARVVVDAALAVHRELGPGLLESAYAAALQLELAERGVPFEREWPIVACYRGRPLGVAYRADLLVGSKLLVELKAVSQLEPLHTALKNGIRRVANGL